MKSKFFQDEVKAIAHLTIERTRGLHGYIVKYRAGTYEVRCWL